MQKLYLGDQQNLWDRLRVPLAFLLLLLGMSVFSSCHADDKLDAAAFERLSTDSDFLRYMESSQQLVTFIAADSINFAKGAGAVPFEALQNASGDAERVEILQAAGCSGHLARYIQLKALNIDCKQRLRNTYSGMSTDEFRKATRDFRTQHGINPDFEKLLKQKYDAERTNQK